ncbi:MULTISPECIES: GDSL-type esterase/lipase family protein [unclassified Streptomyces]|uniref:GDSL-type esterase/lipase family protein n=1 Tax=unclassified Streptomyces TaxID=2593676 RepID=UPI0033AECF64
MKAPATARRRLRALPLLLTLLIGLLGFAPPTAAAASGTAAPVRVMPLGDSITGSPGCWRAMLWNRLQSAGHRNVDFVGTLGPQGCGQPYDGDNEGHGGYLATNVADQNLLPGWLAATSPDVVVMHFGTNDVWSALAPDRVLAAYTTLVRQMRAQNPDMKILVAQLIPMNPSTCTACAQRVVDLNQRIPAWAATVTTERSPVTVVDQWTGFDTATDTYDGVHPNASGDTKLAARWYPALVPYLSPGDPGDPGDPAPGGGACTASFRVATSWQGGFQGEVTVKNTSATPLGWTVTLVLNGGARVSQLWNATMASAPDGATTVTPASWNASLAPGTSATFGFLATGPADGGTPSVAVSCTARPTGA